MDFLKIYIIDIVLILIFMLCIGYYYRKGFVRSILEFCSFFVAVVVTKIYYAPLAQYLLTKTEWFSGSSLPGAKANIFSIIFLFVAAFIIIRIIIRVIDKFFKLPVIKTANKALGLVIGALCGFIAVTFICVVLNAFNYTSYETIKEVISTSRIMELDQKLLEEFFPKLF